MAYHFEKMTLYKRELFNFKNGDQDINVAFEPIRTGKYLMIIFADNGNKIENYHDDTFKETLNNILVEFDDDNGYEYQVAAV